MNRYAAGKSTCTTAFAETSDTLLTQLLDTLNICVKFDAKILIFDNFFPIK